MTDNCSFLAITAGVVVVRAGLQPQATGEFVELDAELIAVCAQHPAMIKAINQDDSDVGLEDDPLWAAYGASRDFISAAKPRTIEGMQAKARVAKAEAVGLDGLDHPDGSMGEIWAWDLLADLLRLHPM